MTPDEQYWKTCSERYAALAHQFRRSSARLACCAAVGWLMTAVLSMWLVMR